MDSVPVKKMLKFGPCVALALGLGSMGCIRVMPKPVTVSATEVPEAEAEAELEVEAVKRPLRIPEPSGMGTVTVLLGERRQRLDGFGASVAWYMERIVASAPQSIDPLLFSELGLDILRLRNRYDRTKSNDRDLSKEVEIVRRATEALGRRPKILLSSWSPPAALKANQYEDCSGQKDCTLVRKNGRFVYGEFADYWLDSLRHYAKLGLTPDYISIQHEPDFIPGAGTEGGRSELGPTEQTTEEPLAFSAGQERVLARLSRHPRFGSEQRAARTPRFYEEPSAARADGISLGGRQFFAQPMGSAAARQTDSALSSTLEVLDSKQGTWYSEPGYVARRMEGCRFDPTETAEFPGYDRALAAVRRKLVALRSPPKLVAPETRHIHQTRVENYLRPLSVDQVDVVGHHLYAPGGLGLTGWREPGPGDFVTSMQDLELTNRTLVWQAGFRTEGDMLVLDQRPLPPRPIWQTEFGTDEDNGIEGGFETAWMIHNALVDGGVAAFLYWNLVWSEKEGLVSLEPKRATPRDQYYAVKHYARYTDPGYVRIETVSDAPELRASAFISPRGDQLTLVVLNTDMRTLIVSLDNPDFEAQDSSVYRTVFRPGRSERWKELGRLPEPPLLTLPGRSSATIVLRRRG